jgi:hypothetical protein
LNLSSYLLQLPVFMKAMLPVVRYIAIAKVGWRARAK